MLKLLRQVNYAGAVQVFQFAGIDDILILNSEKSMAVAGAAPSTTSTPLAFSVRDDLQPVCRARSHTESYFFVLKLINAITLRRTSPSRTPPTFHVN